MEFKKKNILVVDDQPGVRYLLDTIVCEEGHNCFQASNGAEAVEMAQKMNPDLVFMDVRMPVMDGTQALAAMNELGVKTKVVIMTAFTDKDVIEKAYQNGAIRCIIKPFDVDEIRLLIEDVSSERYSNINAS